MFCSSGVLIAPPFLRDNLHTALSNLNTYGDKNALFNPCLRAHSVRPATHATPARSKPIGLANVSQHQAAIRQRSLKRELTSRHLPHPATILSARSRRRLRRGSRSTASSAVQASPLKRASCGVTTVSRANLSPRLSSKTRVSGR